MISLTPLNQSVDRVAGTLQLTSEKTGDGVHSYEAGTLQLSAPTSGDGVLDIIPELDFRQTRRWCPY